MDLKRKNIPCKLRTYRSWFFTKIGKITKNRRTSQSNKKSKIFENRLNKIFGEFKKEKCMLQN